MAYRLPTGDSGQEVYVTPISAPKDAPVKPRTGNKRATVRYRCAPATIGKLSLSDDHEFQHAWIENLSRAGVGLVLARPLGVGTDVLLQLRAAESDQVFEQVGQVAHCTRQPQGDWAVGCEFARPLAADDLDRLL